MYTIHSTKSCLVHRSVIKITMHNRSYGNCYMGSTKIWFPLQPTIRFPPVPPTVKTTAYCPLNALHAKYFLPFCLSPNSIIRGSHHLKVGRTPITNKQPSSVCRYCSVGHFISQWVGWSRAAILTNLPPPNNGNSRRKSVCGYRFSPSSSCDVCHMGGGALVVVTHFRTGMCLYAVSFVSVRKCSFSYIHTHICTHQSRSKAPSADNNGWLISVQLVVLVSCVPSTTVPPLAMQCNGWCGVASFGAPTSGHKGYHLFRMQLILLWQKIRLLNEIYDDAGKSVFLGASLGLRLKTMKWNSVSGFYENENVRQAGNGSTFIDKDLGFFTLQLKSDRILTE